MENSNTEKYNIIFVLGYLTYKKGLQEVERIPNAIKFLINSLF